MLKQYRRPTDGKSDTPAAFGRLCVETMRGAISRNISNCQPPSGGCVLKQPNPYNPYCQPQPAAFGRLCVETYALRFLRIFLKGPAAFGRLCVETLATTNSMTTYSVSRLWVAVCSNIVQADYSSSVRRKLPAKRDSFMI